MASESSFDMRDLMLEATAEVQEIMRELMQEFTMPMMRAQIKQMWMTAPDAMKEQFQKERPEEYAALKDMME